MTDLVFKDRKSMTCRNLLDVGPRSIMFDLLSSIIEDDPAKDGDGFVLVRIMKHSK